MTDRSQWAMGTRIHDDAYDKFPLKSAPSTTSEKPFAMYSYEIIAYRYWDAFIKQLVENGHSEEFIRDALTHSSMRHYLDNVEDELDDLAIRHANKYKPKKDVD